MRVKLEQLQDILATAVRDERVASSLKEEITRALGNNVIVDCSLKEAAANANNKLDILERTGHANRISFKPSTMLKFLEHPLSEVRKLAARTAPEKFVMKMINDKSLKVKYAVAKRVPLTSLVEMVRNNREDDELMYIYETRKLNEAGLPNAKSIEEPFDIYGEKRLGDSAKQWEGTELSDKWYEDKANKFIVDYGSKMEFQWEEIAAKRFASSTRATSGVQVDERKLLKAIKDLVKQREDDYLSQTAIKETVSWLRAGDDAEMMNESMMPIIEESIDLVKDLVRSGHSGSEFITRMNELFAVKECTVPAAIRKYRIGESMSTLLIPAVAKVPGGVFRNIDEKALDMYCEAWNKRQVMAGEPIRIDWTTHPDEMGKVSFTVVLK